MIEQGPGEVPEPPVQSEAVSPPGGGQTAYVNTWALGPLAPGADADSCGASYPSSPAGAPFTTRSPPDWPGRPRRVPPAGGPCGAFTVAIAPAPPATHVDPEHRPRRPARPSPVPPSSRDCQRRAALVGPLSKDRFAELSPRGDALRRVGLRSLRLRAPPSRPVAARQSRGPPLSRRIRPAHAKDPSAKRHRRAVELEWTPSERPT